MTQCAVIVEWYGPYDSLEAVREANEEANKKGYVLCMALGGKPWKKTPPVTDTSPVGSMPNRPMVVPSVTLATNASIWAGLPLSVRGNPETRNERSWKRRNGRSSTRFARS